MAVTGGSQNLFTMSSFWNRVGAGMIPIAISYLNRGGIGSRGLMEVVGVKGVVYCLGDSGRHTISLHTFNGIVWRCAFVCATR